MREIKYRAWDKTCSFYLNAEDIVLNDGKIFRDWIDLNDDYPSDNIELEQYTGLKDKNGKEIYDGDVVNVIHRISKLSGTGRVYWCDDGAYWGIRTMLPFLLHTADEVEVIGNIHENPELLER